MPTAKPSAGSVNDSRRGGAGAVRGQRHEAPAGDGLALEGARHLPVGGVLRLGLFAGGGHDGGNNTDGAAVFRPQLALCHAHGRLRGARLPCGLRRLRVALGVRLRRARDHVGQHLDRLEVPELGQARPGRARRAGRRRAAPGRDPRGAGRARRRSAGGSPRRSPRPARRSPGRRARPATPSCVGSVTVSASRPPLGSDRGRERLERAHSISANAAAAASSVRSTCSGVCASDGNQASNCDGGG